VKPDETGGLSHMLRMLVGKPYKGRGNIDVLDGLVNGAIGTLCYVEQDVEAHVERLWLIFGDTRIGRLLRVRCRAHVIANSDLNENWIPIGSRTSSTQLKSKIITCTRTQFPLVEACAIAILKLQGSTYNTIVYEYD